MVIKNPRAIVSELISYGLKADGSFAAHLNQVESQTGVSLLNDVAAPLGSDATFAIDGPGLPTSAWKVAVEAYDPERLKQTLATLVDSLNRQSVSHGSGAVQITSQQVGALIVYSIAAEKTPGFSIFYTFVDGYLLAAGNQGNLLAAIQNKRTGQTLASSSAFRAKLPADGFTNFSAMFYQNVANTVGPLAEQLKDSVALTPQQRLSLAVLSSGGPGLICLYGEPDRITAASTGSFLGFNLGTLAGIYQGKPVAPLIASNAALFGPNAAHPNAARLNATHSN